MSRKNSAFQFTVMIITRDKSETACEIMNYHPFIPWLEVVVCLVSAISPHSYCSEGSCEEGEKLATSGDCIQCDKGTFMDYKRHACRTCKFCSSVTSPDEIIVAPCTYKVDTHIVCREGYFNAGHNSHTTRSCIKCRECTHSEYMWRNCTATKDTGCRPATTASDTDLNDESTRLENYLNTTETVIVNESTRLKNYLNATETAIMVNETSGNHTSINTTTVLLEGKPNSYYTYIVLACVLSVIGFIIIFIIVKFRDQIRKRSLCKCKNGNYDVNRPSSPTRKLEIVALINFNPIKEN